VRLPALPTFVFPARNAMNPACTTEKGKPKPRSDLSKEGMPRDGPQAFVPRASAGSQCRAGLAKDMEQSLSQECCPARRDPETRSVLLG